MAITLLLIESLVSTHTQLERDFGYPLNRVMRVVWPSSVWLMATAGIEGTPTDFMFISMSVLANVFLYGAVGCVLWGLKRIIRH